MNKKFLLIGLAILLAAGITFIIFGDTKSYSEKMKERELVLPLSKDVEKITIKSHTEVEIDRKSEIEYLIWTIENTARTRVDISNTDAPTKSDDYLTATIYLRDGTKIVLYFYELEEVAYLEEPNKAIYTEGGIRDVYERFVKEDDETIEKFYDDKLLDEYVRIDRLSHYYLSTAISNNRGIVVNYNTLYGETSLDNFLNTVKRGKSAFLRMSKNSFTKSDKETEMTRYNSNSAITYYDLKYEKAVGFTLITNDYSYDKKDIKLKIAKYKNIAKLDYEDEPYLVLSNSKIVESNFNPNAIKNSFVLKLETKMEDEEKN